MRRVIVSTEHAPRAIGPYSQAVQSGDLLFLSGQIALDPVTGQLVGDGDVRRETEQVLANAAAVLRAGGASFAEVAKATIFLVDMADFAVVNEVYGRAFEGLAPPARSTVAVAALPRGARVEIEFVARVGG
jgi:2-iminobutanoate/2-iminopropanoate deaminase